MLFKTQFRSIRMKPSKKQQIVNFQIHNTHTIQLNDIHFVQKGDLFIEKENGHSTFKVNMKNTCVREREREIHGGGVGEREHWQVHQRMVPNVERAFRHLGQQF